MGSIIIGKKGPLRVEVSHSGMLNNVLTTVSFSTNIYQPCAVSGLIDITHAIYSVVIINQRISHM